MPKRAFLILFFVSGATSLIYEIVFHKLLAYAFGSSTMATTTVLVTFMGGLALGGRLIGARVDKLRHPLAIYGWLEFAIGVYVLAVPSLLELCVALYARLGVSSSVHDLFHVSIRFALSALVLALPTVLMGGTLPLLARGLAHDSPQAERSISRLYAINTFGAAFGTLLANYLLLPYLGIYGTLGLGALLNGLILLRALRLANASTPLTAAPVVAQAPLTASGERRLFRMALPAAFAVGMISFVYEVVWTHLLATIVGMSVYAFGLMLATFLVGLAVGGWGVSRGIGLRGDRFGAIALLQLGQGGVVLATLPLWDKLPLVFARVGELHPSFVGMEATRATVCAAMLLPPSTLIGATFPILLSSASFERTRMGARVGLLYALNTSGCIVGAVLTGFFLLEWLGSRSLLMAAAFASIALGMAHAALSTTRRGLRLTAASSFSAAMLLLSARLPPWDWRSLAAGMNVNFSRGGQISELVWSREDSQGGLTTVTRERRGLTLRTNGKFQADDRTELAAQQGFALIPLLFVPAYGAALNIGYGSGVTAGVLSRFPFRRIEVAELSPSMVEASDRYFSRINFSAERDARTHIVYNDGRNHLLVSRERYDLITVEITSIWFAGAANLYNKEFYALCRDHLTRGGVLQQWVQLHHIEQRDLLVIWNTLHSVFPYVSLWLQGTQGSLVASMQPQLVRYPHVQEMNERTAAAPVLARLKHPDFFALLGAQQLDAQGMQDILRELPRRFPRFALPYLVSSDYYPYLEYATPRGYALPDSAERDNLVWIRSYDRHVLPQVTELPDRAAAQRIALLAAAGSGDCQRLRRLGATGSDLEIETIHAALLRCAQR